MLGQQLPGQPSTWTTSVHLPAVADGGAAGTERAGAVVLGHSYAWAGLRRDAEGIALVHGTMDEDAAEEETRTHRVLTADPTAEASLSLRIDVDAAGRITLRAEDSVLLEDWQAAKGHWVGAEVGLFATVESMVHHDLTERRASFGPVTVHREGREI